ncbi:MAG: transglycosylase domain-containing protein [Sphingomonas sp.]|uniref:transglycosylase domain-containing protein n=1 Tax=Sphingomonas sp. TaxID=28214 RepID=UPI0025E31BF2|nr:transglycosylase domain-containing protein [Sphingomonas sp.]MBX9880541.1 transglycosylase domain-containing protein [Sphingomonas sp.]
MRLENFPPRQAPAEPEPLELSGGLPPPDRPPSADEDDAGDWLADEAAPPPPRRRWRLRWAMRGVAALLLLFFVAVGWLAVTAPLSKSLEPPTPPSITLLAADGTTPIARRGAIIGKPVDAARLPAHVTGAFIAIEDRRFRDHWGVDPWGIARAMAHNVAAGGLREGGSTITQQLAKNAFLDSDRTAARKLREVLIAFWLEAWLSKDEILSRYLSNVYFGDNVYGLGAAARHYFSTTPDRLTVAQAALLAGLVKAPSRLAPTGNLAGARARQKLVVAAMADTGVLSKAEAEGVRPARLRLAPDKQLPDGSYFADWVLPAARDQAGAIAAETKVVTTLDARLQRAAERAVRRAGLRKAQVALVAMRPDGRIVAMVGGRDYAKSPFNRATQARRQPGSAFKLFVYLAALRQGMTPDSMIDDEPVTIGDWSPKNNDGRYRGRITLREAFARSSNVAAARLTQQVGVAQVIRAARDLGISTPLPSEATIALGTGGTSLLELTAAYASIAAGAYPVRPHGLDAPQEKSWLDLLGNRAHPLGGRVQEGMRDLLAASIGQGTGHQAALSIDAFGKTGTSQDARDALFLGFAGDLVVGVWVGNDDNSPNPGLSGGGIPARLWRDFMTSALGVAPARPPEVEEPDPEMIIPGLDGLIGNEALPLEGELNGMGLNVKLGRDGSITLGSEGQGSVTLGGDGKRPPPPEEPREPRRREGGEF